MGAEGLHFASEMKSILRNPSVTREVDRESVDKYFSYGYIPAPGTIFKGISKLRPGHYLVLEGESLRVGRYWDVAYGPIRTAGPRTTTWRNSTDS